ncbi:MAG: hypothetical protein ACREBW_04360 [Candidatus Micrarchaeaceae archaeon]
MLAEYKTKTNIGVGLGIVAELVGNFLLDPTSRAQAVLGAVIILVGFVMFIWGCVQYAKGKGHSGWFGLLGLVSIFGLLVLVFLPDRHKGVRA